MREAQLSQLRAKEAEAADKVRAANDRVVEGLNAERAALTSTERERYVAQALSRLSGEATAQQRREVEELAGALYDEQQALQARQRLMDEGRSVVDRTRSATEQYAAEVEKLDELLAAGAIDQQTYTRAVEEANDRALGSSQAWTDGATRFLKDYVAESQDAASAAERALGQAFSGAEDALTGFVTTGKLEIKGLADSVLADITRMAVRQTITAPIAGFLQGALTSGGGFGLFHEGGVVGERPQGVRYADAGVFEHAPRYHGGGFAGSGLLPDEVLIIARRGELVVPPERVSRDEKTQREQRPITVMINVTAADANSFRASQGQIATRWRGPSIGRAATGDVSLPRRRFVFLLRSHNTAMLPGWLSGMRSSSRSRSCCGCGSASSSSARSEFATRRMRRCWPRRSSLTSSSAVSASSRSLQHGHTARRGRELRNTIRQTGPDPDTSARGVRA